MRGADRAGPSPAPRAPSDPLRRLLAQRSGGRTGDLLVQRLGLIEPAALELGVGLLEACRDRRCLLLPRLEAAELGLERRHVGVGDQCRELADRLLRRRRVPPAERLARLALERGRAGERRLERRHLRAGGRVAAVLAQQVAVLVERALEVTRLLEAPRLLEQQRHLLLVTGGGDLRRAPLLEAVARALGEVAIRVEVEVLAEVSALRHELEQLVVAPDSLVPGGLVLLGVGRRLDQSVGPALEVGQALVQLLELDPVEAGAVAVLVGAEAHVALVDEREQVLRRGVQLEPPRGLELEVAGALEHVLGEAVDPFHRLALALVVAVGEDRLVARRRRLDQRRIGRLPRPLGEVAGEVEVAAGLDVPDLPRPALVEDCFGLDLQLGALEERLVELAVRCLGLVALGVLARQVDRRLLEQVACRHQLPLSRRGARLADRLGRLGRPGHQPADHRDRDQHHRRHRTDRRHRHRLPGRRLDRGLPRLGCLDPEPGIAPRRVELERPLEGKPRLVEALLAQELLAAVDVLDHRPLLVRLELVLLRRLEQAAGLGALRIERQGLLERLERGVEVGLLEREVARLQGLLHARSAAAHLHLALDRLAELLGLQRVRVELERLLDLRLGLRRLPPLEPGPGVPEQQREVGLALLVLGPHQRVAHLLVVAVEVARLLEQVDRRLEALLLDVARRGLEQLLRLAALGLLLEPGLGPGQLVELPDLEHAHGEHVLRLLEPALGGEALGLLDRLHRLDRLALADRGLVVGILRRATCRARAARRRCRPNRSAAGRPRASDPSSTRSG